MKQDLYGISFVEDRSIINRLRYRGKGRPRASDYQTLQEAQRQVNGIFNRYLESTKTKRG